MAWYRTGAVSLAIACLWLSGCGDSSYKRGGGADNLVAAQALCRKGEADTEAYSQCMQAQGWTVLRMEDFDPVATVVPNHDNRRAAADIPAPAPRQAGPADPLDRYTIGSWWKAGGKPEELKTATQDCVARLGEAHRPAPGSRQATRGLLLCLREQGWIGLQEK